MIDPLEAVGAVGLVLLLAGAVALGRELTHAIAEGIRARRAPVRRSIGAELFRERLQKTRSRP